MDYKEVQRFVLNRRQDCYDNDDNRLWVPFIVLTVFVMLFCAVGCTIIITAAAEDVDCFIDVLLAEVFVATIVLTVKALLYDKVHDKEHFSGLNVVIWTVTGVWMFIAAMCTGIAVYG